MNKHKVYQKAKSAQEALWIKVGLAFAVLWTLLPISTPFVWWVPHLAWLIILYAVLFRSASIGLGTVMLVGLFIDILQGTLIGAHAFGLIFAASLAYLIRFRFGFYTLWQQSCLVFVLTLIYINIVFSLQYFLFELILTWHHWGSALTTALCWPLLHLLLQQKQKPTHMHHKMS